LHRLAREAIRSGTLPRERPEGAWGGPGSGEACAVCGDPVKADELGYEVEFAGHVGPSGPGICQLHIRCFSAWELESRNFEVSDHGGLRRVRNPDSIPAHGRDTAKRQE
jgi:hypothetical protein